MLGARAARIAQAQPKRSATASQSGRSSQSKLSPEQRIAGWRRFAYKFMIILQYLNTKARMALVLGKETFERAFLSTKKTIENKKGETKEVNRVIKGEIVGKELPTKGEGVPKMDPAMCPHTESEMVRKSNARKDGKGMSWWTCTQCKTRWERFTLDEAAQSKEAKEIVELIEHFFYCCDPLRRGCGRALGCFTWRPRPKII